jgi:hypothetical protein
MMNCEVQDRGTLALFRQDMDSQGRKQEIQLAHLNERYKIDNLRYDSQRCWESLAEMYLKEAACPPLEEQNALER